MLRLKMVGHYGAFFTQTVGGRPQAAGSDGILSHRLLKNGVGRESDYALLTRSALQRMNLDPNGCGLSPHTERYEHFGEVECEAEIDRASMYAWHRSCREYCLPTCGDISEQPIGVVTLFASASEAAAKGLSPCPKCRPDLHPLAS